MKPTDLPVHYRNLLISLARLRVNHRRYIVKLRTLAITEEHHGVRSGLLCKANAFARAASDLEFALSKNRTAMKQFFGTSDLNAVADHTINKD